MTDGQKQEILATLEEIAGVAGGLGSDLTDKKGISDVMLALEKILPPLREQTPPRVARLAQTLALLYEKFLMEMVGDGQPGLEATLDGIRVIQAAVDGLESDAQLEAAADELVVGVAAAYEIVLPPVEPSRRAEAAEPSATPEPPAAGEAEDGSGGNGNSEDDFFAGMSSVPPPAPKENGDGEESVEASRYSEIAGMVTELDDQFTDKKLVSDLLLAFEKVSRDLGERGAPGALVELTAGLSAVFEQALMLGVDNGPRALELIIEGLRVLEAEGAGFESADSIAQWAAQTAGAIRSELGVDFAAAPPPPSHWDSVDPHAQKKEDGGSAPAPSAPAPSSAPAKTASGAEAVPGRPVTPEPPAVITVASEEDLLLYSEFVSETSDTVTTIEEGLLELEENPSDDELINTLFRAFHSLKGAAGFLGLSTINVLCHECETLLDKLRKHELSCAQEMIDAFLKSGDVIKNVNEQLSANAQEARGALPDARLELPRYDISGLIHDLSELAAGRGVAPRESDGGEGEEGPEERIGDILVKQQKISADTLERALHEQKPVGKILVEMGAVDEQTVATALAEQENKRKKVSVASLKVDTEKLDSLLELVGELVISQSIVAQDSVLDQEEHRALSKHVTNLGKITRNIQDHVMGLRMIPLRQTFQKMSRLVRDLSKKMRKPVHLDLVGEDTEIDKTLIEELNDPLVHLMRNSLDHGIESPEDRRAAGKNPGGTVKLAAFHKGGNVYIEITDDGKGLDHARIREKAIERGLIAPDAELSEAEACNLILLPGFSTAAKITDVSGRGVGMDVVRSNIDRLGGRLELATRAGKGTTVTIKLPLTMAIVDGMIVQIGAERFIIPTISIRESIRPQKSEISTVRREGEMINVRGHLLPLVRLANLLNVANPACYNPWEGLVIIVESDDREYGLLVDDLLGQQQVVVKSLGRRFKGLPGISGGTILGDGRVGLILDVAGVVGMG